MATNKFIFNVPQSTNLDPTYEYIGRLAQGLGKENLVMKASTLRLILINEGLWQYEEGRGIYSGLRGAYNHWKNYATKNKIASGVAEAIANVFVNENGVPEWDK